MGNLDTPLLTNGPMRVPCSHGEGTDGEIEIRQIFKLDDFAPSPAIDRAQEMGRQLAKRKR